MTIRAYLDTSVFGGTQDPEFQAASLRIIRYVMKGRIEVLTSNTTIDEITDAPQAVRDVLKQLGDERVTIVEQDERVRHLARSYIERGALGRRNLGDALHVAAATVGGAHVILSWNFKHIVNYARISKFNEISTELGARGYRNKKSAGD